MKMKKNASTKISLEVEHLRMSSTVQFKKTRVETQNHEVMRMKSGAINRSAPSHHCDLSLIHTRCVSIVVLKAQIPPRPQGYDIV